MKKRLIIAMLAALLMPFSALANEKVVKAVSPESFLAELTGCWSGYSFADMGTYDDIYVDTLCFETSGQLTWDYLAMESGTNSTETAKGTFGLADNRLSMAGKAAEKYFYRAGSTSCDAVIDPDVKLRLLNCLGDDGKILDISPSLERAEDAQ